MSLFVAGRPIPPDTSGMSRGPVGRLHGVQCIYVSHSYAVLDHAEAHCGCDDGIRNFAKATIDSKIIATLLAKIDDNFYCVLYVALLLHMVTADKFN